MSAHKNAKDGAPTFDHSLVKENTHQLLHSGTRSCFKINKEETRHKTMFPSLSSLTLAFSSVGKHLLNRSTFSLHSQGNDYTALHRAWGHTEAMTTARVAMTRQGCVAASSTVQERERAGQDEKWQMQGGKSPNQQPQEPGFRTTGEKQSSQNKQIQYELRELEMPAQSEWDFSHLFINYCCLWNNQQSKL